MAAPKLILFLALVWFFGWGALVLRFPRACYRVLAWGKEPGPRNLKLARMVGFLGIGCGFLLLVGLALGLVPFR